MTDNPFQEDFDIKHWCQQFKEAPTVPMDTELTQLMMAVMLGNLKRDVLEEMFLYKVVKARADALGLTINPQLVDFLAILCKSPSESSMYLSLLRQEQEDGNPATLENFVNIFPWGFPTQDTLSTLWDAQKTKDAPLGNALDIHWWACVNPLTEGDSK